MKIKKIKLWLALALVPLVYSACDDDKLDWGPLGETEASFFTEEFQFEQGILGAYAKLTDLYWYGASGGPGFLHRIWLLPGDDITVTGTEPFEIFENIQPGNGQLGAYYEALYRMINRANSMIQTIDERGEGVYTTPNLMQNNKGEALFLRGYAHFMLWNVFCTSPVVAERIIGPDKINPPSSSGTELLDQAISDFKEAATLLPPSWSEANRGRATQSSANGFLGKALVYRATVTNNAADYTAAIEAFNKITDKSLVANFADNFNVATENNSESLFEYQANSPTGFDNVWLSNDFDNPIGSISAYYGYYENHWSLFGPPYNGTSKLYNAFDPADPRRDLTVIHNPDDAPNPYKIQKYWTQDAKTGSNVASHNNTRMLRYADVLLLEAEAIVKSGGNLTEAIELINQIRTRARNMAPEGVEPANRPLDGASRETVMDWIMQERFLEFAGEEGIRWFDLRRWHLGGQIDLSNWNFDSMSPEIDFDAGKNLCFPIPNREIDLNPNVTQNPGY